MNRPARISAAWGLNPCLPSPPGGQVRTAPNALPPASGAGVISNPVAKASEDNGRTSTAMGALAAGEASRPHGADHARGTPLAIRRDSVERHAPVSADVGGPEGRKRLQVPREPKNAAEPDGCDPVNIADGGRDVEASGGAASVVTLSDASAFILSLICAHQGRPAGDILAQLIVGAAEAIGIHSLILRDAAQVDFADVPDFARAAANRFRSGVP